MSSAALQRADKQYIMGTYGRYPIALVRGQGLRVWDADGKEYLDFLGGIAVNILGHCHPAVVRAIQEQSARLLHTSNLYYTEPGVRLAEALVQAGGLGKVFFCNSGAEANEGAFKLARKYHWRQGERERHRIISVTHSFHGRTLATVTATAKPELQEGFAPLPPGFAHVAWGDISALERVVDRSTAAVIIEPVQGEGGIHVADPGYLSAVRELTRERGALLILDEIQCGMGRLGRFYAYQAFGVVPDIITLAKGLGGGLPIGALLATEQVADTGFQPGDHGSTFGANLVTTAAALATVETILGENLPARAAEMGVYLVDALRQVQARHPDKVREVRGLGLMVGIELTGDGRAVLNECHQRGLLANVTAGHVLRLLPALTVTQAEVDAAVEIIEAAIDAVPAGAAG